jgi:hypothetical protein
MLTSDWYNTRRFFMHNEPGSAVRVTTPGMRTMLLIASGLVFIVGIQLFILGTETERFFAWTINPPLTAAFMGAAYWSSCVLEFMAAREKIWARARVGVPAVLLFTALTFIFTLKHITMFHLDTQDFALYTVLLTWVWIAVYAIVPLALAVLLVLQLRAPGGDPPRQHALPAWMRAILVLQALLMLPVGAILFFAPTMLVEFWPWELTPAAGEVHGAWWLGLGLAAVHMAWENDFSRVSAALSSMLAFAVLQFIALARFAGDINWGLPQAWGYVGFLLSFLVVGVVGIWQARTLKDAYHG